MLVLFLLLLFVASHFIPAASVCCLLVYSCRFCLFFRMCLPPPDWQKSFCKSTKSMAASLTWTSWITWDQPCFWPSNSRSWVCMCLDNGVYGGEGRMTEPASGSTADISECVAEKEGTGEVGWLTTSSLLDLCSVLICGKVSSECGMLLACTLAFTLWVALWVVSHCSVKHSAEVL